MTVASPRLVAAPPPALEEVLRRVDERAERFFPTLKAPGLAYGIVLGGELIHARGMGTLRVGEDAVPDARSVFRIASMTKSFTAATVLSLRDAGLLRLDDEIAQHVPELADLRYPTADSPRITIRHLLTMTAGLATDDPWGDRQQGLDVAAFSRILAGGLSFAWVPGTRFEYSNTGYGILGRLVTNVAGREYREVVRERLLEPLGMDSTGYLEDEVEPDRLARGYLWRDDAYIPEPMDGYGALASMGGIFTSIEDLARWVRGFLDAVPPRDEPEGGHPLSRATRREMQQPMVLAELRLSQASTDGMPEVESVHYGFGLFQVDDVHFGRIVGHAGGYPGFGTHMRWHPASGLGVIAVANGRYAPSSLLARDVMADILAADALPLRRTRPTPATQRARDAVERLIERWDDALAGDLFAMNVELDEPIELRRTSIEAMKARHGALRPDPVMPSESHTPLHLAWWLAGERGRVKVEILLSPELPARVQSLTITSVPEPTAELRRAAAAIVAAMRTPEQGPVTIDWPADVATGDGLDIGAAVRAMRAAEARFAPLELGPVIDGDGERKATFRLDGPRGRVDLALAFDPEAGCLASVALEPPRQVPPFLD
jgi:CubicO group peptidase (beta-lactamase class C family)